MKLLLKFVGALTLIALFMIAVVYGGVAWFFKQLPF